MYLFVFMTLESDLTWTDMVPVAVYSKDQKDFDNCSPMVWETWVQSKTLKMVLDTSLLNTQQYKVCIKGKVEQSWR